jgi:hypothetical protein
MSTARWLEHWFSGIVAADLNPDRRVVVVATADLADRAVAEFDDGISTVLVPRNAHLDVLHRNSRVVGYRGSFLPADGRVSLPDATIELRSYGLAEFGELFGPTVLRVADDEDFSAYLRDADAARLDGRFAPHLTNPRVLVADLAALGGPAERSGPRDRLLVRPDGTISTSPTGGAIGRLGESTADLDRTWREHVSCSVAPCPVCLSAAVPERDRADALRERPWLARYLTAIEALRAAGRDGRTVGRVSGFGGRISPVLPWSPAVLDPVDAPVIIEIDDPAHLLVHDPVTGQRRLVGVASGAELEAGFGDPGSG